VAIVAMVNQTAIKTDRSDHHGSDAGGNQSDAMVCTGPEDDAGGDQSVMIFLDSYLTPSKFLFK